MTFTDGISWAIPITKHWNWFVTCEKAMTEPNFIKKPKRNMKKTTTKCFLTKKRSIY